MAGMDAVKHAGKTDCFKVRLMIALDSQKAVPIIWVHVLDQHAPQFDWNSSEENF